ncbi:alanine/glycine:cation symporter family protein [Actinorugispora endophytica]|uniref:AGCS family alanine or glycine:cation symporter n=1 Tax=Actinorugispora endophytica TaxID=1605990 RepID=A0A4R6V2Z6_9ACTN|nr:alanine/glycine:cation symporter family protein [Actinorugispora endophytica]TDQ53060.1 AGCS family alanine or glycine:cation symporter [Actinorugispora endophytica]
MQAMTDALGVVNDNFWTFLVIPLLVIASLYFTVRSGAVQLRLVPEMLRTMFETPEAAPDGKKAISSFQAFSISAAARVGTGNVAGVAIAIALGGPGAVMWMWIMSIVAGSAAFVESTLAQLYKVRDKTGYRGGPAYYMQHGLKARWLGVIFAVVITFTFGFVFTSVQSNSIAAAVANSVSTVTGAEPGAWLAPAVGVALMVLTGAVIFGGVRSIANVAQAIVPFMAAVYLLMGIAVVAMNIEQVPAVLADIVTSAFGIRQIGAAGLGTAIMMGVRRGLFSNEAGMGSAPNAGATAAVSHPVKQGLTQTFGIYFDTLLVCSITAFIILVSDPVYGEQVGADLTQNALEANLGSWSLHLLTFIIFLLAFTSVLGNYYYGESNLTFLSARPAVTLGYRVAFLLVLFLGAVASLSLVWTLADVTMGVMVVVNLVAIIPMGALAVRLLKDYTDQRRQGLNPVFTRDRLPDVEGVQCWEPQHEESRAESAPAAG